jgi:hypothetical protein
VKRADLIRRVREAAKAAGLGFEVIGGGSHDKLVVGGSRYPLPRHTEINEMTAQGILKHFEPELGEDWWR